VKPPPAIWVGQATVSVKNTVDMLTVTLAVYWYDAGAVVVPKKGTTLLLAGTANDDPLSGYTMPFLLHDASPVVEFVS